MSASAEWVDVGGSSAVWKHFQKRKSCPDKARCKACCKVLKAVATSLCYHSTNIHGVKFEDAPATVSTKNKGQGQEKSKTDILSLLLAGKKESAGLVLARMDALDRIPFATIATSVNLMAGLRARILKVPSCPNGIRDTVFAYAKTIKEAVIGNLAQRIEHGERFSISFDEYTSPFNKR